MSDIATTLDGPDLNMGVPICMIDHGGMLLGHANGEAIVLARWGARSVRIRCFLYTLRRTSRGRIARWGIRSVVRGTTRASRCAPATQYALQLSTRSPAGGSVVLRFVVNEK